jgi:hypothetical protein
MTTRTLGRARAVREAPATSRSPIEENRRADEEMGVERAERARAVREAPATSRSPIEENRRADEEDNSDG